MNDRSLKALEIEALTFIYPTRARPSAAKPSWPALRPWPVTVGVAGLVLLGVLAWFVFPA